MLPLVLACSFPFFGGPPPGGAVYGLLFYCPGPGSPNPDGLGQDLVRYTSFHEGIYARGVEPGWVVCYVRAEAVGPWVYRLAVAGCGDGREYQARMLNALLEGYRDAYVPWRRRDAAEHLRSWDEMLRRDAGRLREMRREATAEADPAKRERLWKAVAEEETGLALREAYAERLRALLDNGYPRCVILRPARP